MEILDEYNHVTHQADDPDVGERFGHVLGGIDQALAILVSMEESMDTNLERSAFHMGLFPHLINAAAQYLAKAIENEPEYETTMDEATDGIPDMLSFWEHCYREGLAGRDPHV